MELSAKEEKLKFYAPIIKILRNYLKGYYPSGDYKFFIFLCGAAKTDPFSRRVIFEKYLRENYPFYEVFLAEDYFMHIGDSQIDLLTHEQFLTEFADCIMIFLESESAFAELGAFSGDEQVSKKILAINNKKFKNVKSFINLGPIELIKKNSKYPKIVYSNFDAVLETADQVIEQIEKIYKARPNYFEIRLSSKNLPDITTYSYKKLINFLIDFIALITPIAFNDFALIFEEIFPGKYSSKVNGSTRLLQTLHFFIYDKGLLYPDVRILDKGQKFSYSGVVARKTRAQILEFYRKNDRQRIKSYEEYLKENWIENI